MDVLIGEDILVDLLTDLGREFCEERRVGL